MSGAWIGGIPPAEEDGTLQAEIAWGRSRLRSRIVSVFAPPGALVWLAASAAAGIVVGASVAHGQVKLAVLPVWALTAVLFARVPVAGYIGILWSVGTAVDPNAVQEVGVSSLLFAPAEILNFTAIACVLFLPGDVRRVVKEMAFRAESVLIALFLAAVLGGVAVGMENGASLHAAAFDMRSMLFYAAFWPALAALARGRRLPFRLVTAGAIVVVMLQAIQVVVGPSRHMFLIAASDLSSALTADQTGFLRVRPPGLTTVYVVAAFALARVLWGPARGRMAGWAVVAVSMAGVILSLNRNMALGLVLGLSAAALVAKRRHRAVVFAATVAAALSAAVLVAQGSAFASNPVVSRFASITNYSQLQTQTLDDRFYENRIAMQRIRAHPIGGLGWGPPYGAELLSSDAGFLVTQPRTFMHEQYLWIWMRAGIVGLIALLAMLAVGITTGVRWSRARAGEEDGWLGAGVIVALVALAASSNVAIYLTPPDSTVPLVGVLALAAYMRRQLTLGRAPA
jgi:hypothetical protein